MATALYVLGALLAAAAAYFLLRRRPDPAPAPGSAFAKYGNNIRVRDLYRLAAMLEEEGEAFYRKMASRVSRPETKKLCEWLADQEAQHRQFVQDQLDRWRRLNPHLTEWPAFLEKVKQEGFFAAPPEDGAGEDRLAAYAIDQERKMADFYGAFESSFPEAARRERIARLAGEERRHEKLLREAYPHLP